MKKHRMTIVAVALCLSCYLLLGLFKSPISSLTAIPTVNFGFNPTGTEVTGVFSDTKKFGDRELRLIESFSSLETLVLVDASITDKGISNLKPIAPLTHLGLDGTLIGNESVKQFGRLFPRLSFLTVSSTQLSDDCLVDLAAIHTLTALDVRRTRISQKGALELQRLRPDLEIFTSHHVSVPSDGASDQGATRANKPA
jgi:hypothetical protein